MSAICSPNWLKQAFGEAALPDRRLSKDCWPLLPR